MSAWLVTKDHINVLITYALDNDVPLPASGPEDACRLLTKENVRSLRSRYPGRDFLKEWEAQAKRYRFKRVLDIPLTVRRAHEKRNANCDGRLGKLPVLTAEALATQIVKACHCYDYQACETADYSDTPAAAFVKRVREKALTLGGAESGAVYDQMSWGI